jgi:hypothetical protein
MEVDTAVAATVVLVAASDAAVLTSFLVLQWLLSTM